MSDIQKRDSKYAGFWWRLLAQFIDGILLNIASYIMMIPLVTISGSMETGVFPHEEIIMTSGMITGISISALTSWLYYTLLESSDWQATPGKKWLGLRVTDMEGQRISFARANARYFSKILSSMILGIGFLMIAFTERKQGLHDIIAGTLVMK